MGRSDVITGTAIYLIGGQTSVDNSSYSPIVRQGIVADDGALTWNWQGTLPQGLRGHAAISYQGSVYTTGGYPVGQPNPTTAIYATYIEENLELHEFEPAPGQDGPNFQGPAEDENPIRLPRGFHQSVTVFDPNAQTAIIYVLGGQGSADDTDPTDNNSSDTVYTQRVVRENLRDPIFVNKGWYRSRPHPIGLNEPQLEAISWDADIDRAIATQDIQISYRTSTNPCETANWSDWVPIQNSTDTGFGTVNGRNNVEIERTITRCFQYEAVFTSNSDTSSPRLKSVAIQVFSPNSADLRVDEETFGWNNDTRDLTVTILNDYTPDPTLTLDADAEEVNEGDIGGRFFVDMFVIGPGYNEAVLEPTLPLTTSAYISTTGIMTSTLFTQLQRMNLPAGGQQTITRWCDSSQSGCTEVDPADLFTESGDYTVCIGVDSFVSQTDKDGRWPQGYVSETLPGAEDNNFSCTDISIVIENLPPPTLTLQLGTTEPITEGLSRDTFNLNFSRALTEEVTINFSVAGAATNPAVFDTDYRLYAIQNSVPVSITNSVVVPVGTESVTILVEAVDNNQDEPDRSFTFTLEPGTGYTLSPTLASGSAIIADNDEVVEEDPTIYLPLVLRRITL
ncbi:MAG: hypothetical protein HC914_01905 [Chloroflexaceae bacterium]|nr:hypothetical protein [Chloroflexaceae bacterium]